MNKEQKALVAKVAAIDAEWHGADGERRGELVAEREALVRDSTVAEALGEAEKERRERDRARQAEGELLGRSAVADVEPDALQAADEAIAAELVTRGKVDGNDPTYRQIVDFIEANRHSSPGFNFVAGVCFAAGKAAPKR